MCWFLFERHHFEQIQKNNSWVANSYTIGSSGLVNSIILENQTFQQSYRILYTVPYGVL
jgi:hypothetical protein